MDRNAIIKLLYMTSQESLSARRAWIEMRVLYIISKTPPVALRKESVDRNDDKPGGTIKFLLVALRKESVDRNNCS